MENNRCSEELRDQLNVIPEDIREIYKLKTGNNGDAKICANSENGWKLMTRLNSRYHRNTGSPQGQEAVYNRKFIRPDELGGSVEAVICFPPGKDPYLVTDPVNKGTYNFISPIRRKHPMVTPHTLIGHIKQDLFPYLMACAEEKKRERTGKNIRIKKNKK